jgi:two-component system KDP operon response regulator KdpE
MTESTPLVLVVEDEPQMRKFVRIALESHDHRVVEAATGDEGIRRATEYTPDAVLLDLGLPDMDGTEVIERIREWSATPILVIAAQSREAPSAVVRIGDEIEIDLVKRVVACRGEEVHLTPIEYKLLTALSKHAGMVMTHKQLLDQVWGPGHAHQMQYLRVYMTQLRHKLELDPARPKYLLTEPGIGYRLRA